MRVYIAGPIAGYPDANRAAFAAAAQRLRQAGHEPLNPHDIPPFAHPGDCPPGVPGSDSEHHTAPCHLRADLVGMLGCDAITLLPGWVHSSGAFLEFSVARATGLRIYFEDAP